MNKDYEFLEHTADSRFKAYGKNQSELFQNAGKALQEIQVDTKTIEEKTTKKIQLENKDIEMLLHKFLQELIYYKDAERLVFKKITVEIEENDQIKLNAECTGEEINSEKHHLSVNPKAITWHKFNVEKNNGVWEAHVIVDI